MRSQESIYGILIGLFLIGLVFVVSSVYYYQFHPKNVEVSSKVYTISDLGDYMKSFVSNVVGIKAREASYIVLSRGFDMDFSCPCYKITSCEEAKRMYENEVSNLLGDFISGFGIFSESLHMYYPYNVSVLPVGEINSVVSPSCFAILNGLADEKFSVYVKNLSIRIEDRNGNLYESFTPVGEDIINNRMWFLYRKVRGWIASGGYTCTLSCNPDDCASSLQEYIDDPYVKCKGSVINYGMCKEKDDSCCRPNGYKICTIFVNCTDYKYYQYIAGENKPLSILISGTLYAQSRQYQDTCVKEYKYICEHNEVKKLELVKKYVEPCTCETENTCPDIGDYCTEDGYCVKKTCCTKTCCCRCCGDCCLTCPTCCK